MYKERDPIAEAKLIAEARGERMHPSGLYESEMRRQPDRSHKPCKKPGRKPKALRGR